MPADFGLLAMVAVFIALANSLMESGFRQALIRKDSLDQGDLNTAFYSNMVLGLVAWALLFASAPWIAAFYQEPRLTNVIRVLGLAVVINSFQLVQKSILNRELHFKALLRATLTGMVASGIIAVLLAYGGAGVWSLVSQIIVASLVTTVVLWWTQAWRPSLSFSNASLRDLFGFGSPLFAAGVLDTVFRNLFVVVIAKLFAASIAGLYFFATKIRDLAVDQLTLSIRNVAYPALSRLQHDEERLKRAVREVLQVMSIVLFPVLSLLAALANPLFELALSQKWIDAVPFLQLLCIAGITYPLHVINLEALKVKGHSGRVLRLEVIKKTTVVSILAVSIQFGIYGILVGQVISSIIGYIPNSYYAARTINYPPREQLADVLPTLLWSMTVGVSVYLLTEALATPPIFEVVILGGASLGFFALGAHLLKLRGWVIIIAWIRGQSLVMRARTRRHVDLGGRND